MNNILRMNQSICRWIVKLIKFRFTIRAAIKSASKLINTTLIFLLYSIGALYTGVKTSLVFITKGDTSRVTNTNGLGSIATFVLDFSGGKLYDKFSW